MAGALHKLVGGMDLTETESYEIASQMFRGGMSPAQMASVLTAMRMKGLAVSEIVGAAKAAQERSVRLRMPEELVAIDREEINLDEETILKTILGNGSGTKTFTISTCCAFVVAGAGLPVAKSGSLGPSDYVSGERVLRALGIEPNITGTMVERSIQEVGLSFLYTPSIQGIWGAALEVQRQMGFRTLLNRIGPLCNPCRAQTSFLGVYEAEALVPLAQVLKALGVRRGVIVHGEDTLDEVSVTGKTTVCFVRTSGFEVTEFFPEDVGLKRSEFQEIQGGSAQDNARIIRDILTGEKGAPRDAVLLSSAMALVAAGRAPDLSEGIEMAGEAVDSGRANQTLEAIVRLTNERAYTRGA